MYKSFEINNFRCFDKFALDNLEQVNLITGLNNSGKTALLEALFAHGGNNPVWAIQLDAFRTGIDTMSIEFKPTSEMPWDSIFNKFDTSKPVKLSGKTKGNGSRTVWLRTVREPKELASIGKSISIPYGAKPESGKAATIFDSMPILELRCENGRKTSKHPYYLIFDQKRGGLRPEPIPPVPPFQTIFVFARGGGPSYQDADRFGALQKSGQKDVLLKALQIIEPRLNTIEMVISGGQSMIYGDIGLGRLIPLSVMGGGLVRLTSLVLAITDAPKGVVLVDEIENGIHHSVLPKLWKAIRTVAQQYDTQIFATTHSFECIAAAHEEFKKHATYDFRLYRLDRINGDVTTVTYDKETLEAAIETGLELR